ncbi:MAG: adenosylmethionine-8-amino-7-oxononanoate aminotransferase [Rubritalea sp.]|jgi:adenosylmethionine-8-amino-7-oxononanoate aminotransferase
MIFSIFEGTSIRRWFSIKLLVAQAIGVSFIPMDHVEIDKQHCWHPFTQQEMWTLPEHQPIMIESGEGVWLKDTEGNKYIDGNSSIWTNIHGHNHPVINKAIKDQLDKISHSSYLGFGHPLASELAMRLVSFFPETDLQRVFFSDDGSTAVECAMKMALQFRIQNSEPEKTDFIAFIGGYHGDTLGAASLGGVEVFFARFRKFGLTVHFVRDLDELRSLPESALDKIAAVIIEPLVQGVNQIHVWQHGMLEELRVFTEEKSIHLILDEVMTGFGRTGTMFACQQEGVIPDFLCLAKGLTGGYLPMAATLVTETIYNGFLGAPERVFYYGHSYTANPLGCAAALASLDIFESENTLIGVNEKATYLAYKLIHLANENSHVKEIRRCGLVAGLEINTDTKGVGAQICEAARRYQLITRPILNTIVLMPPLSITRDEIDMMIAAVDQAIIDVLD